MQAVASVQASGGTALLVDAEHAFDPFFAKVTLLVHRFHLMLHQQTVLLLLAWCDKQRGGKFEYECNLSVSARSSTPAQWARHALWDGYTDCSAHLQSAGVDIKALLINQPDSGETALEVVDKMVRSSAVDIIVIDSVSALVPRAELEGEIGDNRSEHPASE